MTSTGPMLAGRHGGSMPTPARPSGWPRPVDDGTRAGTPSTSRATRAVGQHRPGEPAREDEPGGTGGPFSIANLSLVTSQPRTDAPPGPVGPIHPVDQASLSGGLTVPIPPGAFRPEGDLSERPSAAGVFDALLGGTAHRRVDRRCALSILLAWPDAPAAARVMREFQVRAVRFAARNGVEQFLVLGSGPHTCEPVHETARAVAPASRIVYVEPDPLAIARAHGQAPDHTTMVQAELSQPADVLGHPQVRTRLDVTRPIAIVMVPGLSELGEREDPREVLRRYRLATARGSLLIFSQVCDEGSARGLRALFERTGQPGTPRCHEQTVELVSTWEPIEPGLVPAEEWHAPDERPQPHFGRHPVYASVGWR